MRALRIVLMAPTFDEDLRLMQCIEEFAVQQLIPQLPVEGLHVAVLPGTPWFNEQRRDRKQAIPCPQRRGDELRPIVRPDMRRTAMAEK